MPKDVASSVFHGAWPTRPSTTQAPHSRNSPNCFTARYGPAGLSVESPPAMDACGARRAMGFSGKSRIVVKRAPLKKKAAEARFSGLRLGLLCGGLRSRTGNSGLGNRGLRRLGGVGLAELVDAARGVHHL